MAQPRFTGVMTALVTPFCDDGTLDLAAYRKLIRAQLSAGVHGLVPCGTTGEASTLALEEHVTVVRTCLEEVAGKVPVVAGAGANETSRAIAMQRRMHELGVDGTLQVTPWYNKPSQEGLYRHFRAVAEAAPCPVILYNVPGRTGVDMLPETVVRIARDCPNVVGLKEATGSIQRAQDLVNRLHDVRNDFALLSGDDGLILGLLAIGGHGVISVTSHLCVRELVQMVDAHRQGDSRVAQEKSRRTSPLASILFFRNNPLPVKTALALQGMMKANFRLPLCPLDAAETEQLRALLKAEGWLG